jgi:FixJ family two-component response regulator
VDSIDPIIAVVDDESPMRTMLGRLLKLAGYEVAAYASGEEFLASLGGCLPGCAVLDIHMPGLSGLEVQAELRNAGIEIPVVFITASDEHALDRSAAEQHVTRVLRKPFSSEELLGAVGEALTRKESPH